MHCVVTASDVFCDTVRHPVWASAHSCSTLPVERDHRQMRTVVKAETAWEVAAARALLKQLMDMEFHDDQVLQDSAAKPVKPVKPVNVKEPKCVKSVEMFYFNYCRRRDRGRPKLPLKEYWAAVQAEWRALDPSERLMHQEHWQSCMDASWQPGPRAAGARRRRRQQTSQQLVPLDDHGVHGPDQYCPEAWYRKGESRETVDWRTSPIIDPAVFQELVADIPKGEKSAIKKMFELFPNLAKAKPHIPKLVKWSPPRPELAGVAAIVEQKLLNRALVV